MLKCDVCNEIAYKTIFIGNGIYSCKNCLRMPPKELGGAVINKIRLAHYGSTSENELKEVKSRVMMNLKQDGTYDLFRRNKYGKIEEKEPTYGDWG